MEYKSKAIQSLSQLYLKWDEYIKSQKTSLWVMMWRAISPSLPQLLQALDEDDELRQKLINKVREIADTLVEDDKGKVN